MVMSAHLLDEVRLHLHLLQVEDLHGLEGGQLARPGHGLGAFQGAGARICGCVAVADGTGGYRKRTQESDQRKAKRWRGVSAHFEDRAVSRNTFLSKKIKPREARKYSEIVSKVSLSPTHGYHAGATGATPRSFYTSCAEPHNSLHVSCFQNTTHQNDENAQTESADKKPARKQNRREDGQHSRFDFLQRILAGSIRKVHRERCRICTAQK